MGGLPFVNRLEPTMLGLPFLLAWILGWVVLTPGFLYVAYILGTGARATGSEQARGAGTTEADAEGRAGVDDGEAR